MQGGSQIFVSTVLVYRTNLGLLFKWRKGHWLQLSPPLLPYKWLVAAKDAPFCNCAANPVDHVFKTTLEDAIRRSRPLASICPKANSVPRVYAPLEATSSG